MTPQDKAARLRETYAEQVENLRMLRRAARGAAPSDADKDVQDRFIFRFSQQVDAMRKRLFPHLLDYTEDLPELPSLRDRLNRLEKYGLLATNAWIELGLRRNAFEHDYPDPGLREAALRQAHDMIPVLADTLRACAGWLDARFGLGLAGRGEAV